MGAKSKDLNMRNTPRKKNTRGPSGRRKPPKQGLPGHEKQGKKKQTNCEWNVVRRGRRREMPRQSASRRSLRKGRRRDMSWESRDIKNKLLQWRNAAKLSGPGQSAFHRRMTRSQSTGKKLKKAEKRKEHKLKAKKLKKLEHKRRTAKSSCSIHPGLYSIKTTGVHAGASAKQPAGWGLSAWQKHGARRNGASSWSAVHAGTYWPMIWNIQPSKRTRGTYTIKTTKYGPKGGSQPAGWGLSAWNAHGARRNSASSRVAVHAGNFWLMDWHICPSKRTKGAYTIKTSGVHSKDSAKQPAGWGLAAWQLHGGRRNSAYSWVYVHSGNKWLMDWQLGP